MYSSSTPCTAVVDQLRASKRNRYAPPGEVTVVILASIPPLFLLFLLSYARQSTLDPAVVYSSYSTLRTQQGHGGDA